MGRYQIPVADGVTYKVAPLGRFIPQFRNIKISGKDVAGIDFKAIMGKSSDKKFGKD